MINWTPELEKEYSRFYSIHKSIGLMSDESIIRLFKELKCVPPEQPSKEWEIVFYRNDKTLSSDLKPILVSSKFCWYFEEEIKNFPIHSVRRLKDNVVFTVGDEILIGERNIGKINSFEVWTGAMLIRTENYFEPIFKISHSPKKETLPLEDMPLLSVNDVMSVFENLPGVERLNILFRGNLTADVKLKQARSKNSIKV